MCVNSVCVHVFSVSDITNELVEGRRRMQGSVLREEGSSGRTDKEAETFMKST